MATKAAQESIESLKYQTWVLKVPINCEGCRKTVKKILQSIDGVYTTSVDSLQHKVTVTGNVDLDTLLKKLQRSGKHAEVWPEPPKPVAPKDMKKEMETKDSEEDSTEKSVNAAKNNSRNEIKDSAGSDDETHGKDMKSLEAGHENGGSRGGKNKRKNKKKGQKADSTAERSENTAAAAEADTKTTPSLPPPGVYPYPPMHYPSPTPVYGINYREAHPSRSDASSYFFPPMQSYAYSVPQTYSVHPSFYPVDNHADDGYDHDSGCSIM